MKSQIKTVALSGIFSIIGLCCTLSTASAESNNAQINQDLTTINYIFAFPKLTNEGGVKEKPLLSPDNGVSEFIGCKAPTKNEYFELAIIFNDKLQQLISDFSAGETQSSNDTPLNQLSKVN
jgi:hypothetical protein